MQEIRSRWATGVCDVSCNLSANIGRREGQNTQLCEQIQHSNENDQNDAIGSNLVVEIAKPCARIRLSPAVRVAKVVANGDNTSLWAQQIHSSRYVLWAGTCTGRVCLPAVRVHARSQQPSAYHGNIRFDEAHPLRRNSHRWGSARSAFP